MVFIGGYLPCECPIHPTDNLKSTVFLACMIFTGKVEFETLILLLWGVKYEQANSSYRKTHK